MALTKRLPFVSRESIFFSRDRLILIVLLVLHVGNRHLATQATPPPPKAQAPPPPPPPAPPQKVGSSREKN
jgi:hypothetical protein